MIRYIKQRNCYSCVPIAILNIYKWLGKKVTYKSSYKKLLKQTKCDKNGSCEQNYAKVLYKMPNLFIDELCCGKIGKKYFCELIDYHLKHGCIILIKYFYKLGKKTNSHLALIIKQTPCYYLCLNIAAGETRVYINKRVMKALYFKESDPKAWILSKAVQ
jgi:hypothetical protein